MKNLVNIQNELKVPKGNLNKFGNYKYRSAEDILEAVKPILLKYGATLTLTDDIVSIGNKIFCKATATLMLDSESVLCNGFAETSEHKGMSAEQTTGTASSYSRKYALNGLFLIDETESDADSQKPQETKEQTKKLPELKFETTQYKQTYEKLLAGTVTIAKVKEFYTLSSEVENALKSLK
jgi:hypothetical protein